MHNHQNYAWRETNDRRAGVYGLVRKAATPGFPGQHGFMGGFMGDEAVIIESVDSAEAGASLYSTVH